MKNRYNIQILGIYDSADNLETQRKIYEALSLIEELTLKAVSVDMWCDPNGTVRAWDDEGNEITEGYISIVRPPDNAIEPPVVNKEEDDIEEVVTNDSAEETTAQKEEI